MTRFCFAALCAVMVSACTPPDITSRMDNSDTLYSGFATADNYTPTPVGSRADNDFMRFSTMGVPQ